jgi:hypothetical protein
MTRADTAAKVITSYAKFGFFGMLGYQKYKPKFAVIIIRDGGRDMHLYKISDSGLGYRVLFPQ